MTQNKSIHIVTKEIIYETKLTKKGRPRKIRGWRPTQIELYAVQISKKEYKERIKEVARLLYEFSCQLEKQRRKDESKV